MPAAMEKGGILVCVLALNLLLVASESANEPLTIAAFNVEVFGQTKMGKPEVVNILKQIVHRYDIILIQEIRDISEKTIPEFVALVNNDSSSEDHYETIVSQRLGRTSSKEQYAFLYRSAVLDVISVYQYNDTEDRFEREPFSVQFRTKEEQEEFFLLGIHVKPSDALQELESLLPAFQETSIFFGSEKGVIMGDLNAGCRYLSEGSYDQLSLVIDPDYIWLLGYDADTTVSSSSCPYDRFVVHQSLNSSVIPMSATIFNFTEAYSLTAGLAKNVSDHFPIEFQLQFQDSSSGSEVTSDSSSGFKVTLTLATAGLVVIAIIRCYH